MVKYDFNAVSKLTEYFSQKIIIHLNNHKNLRATSFPGQIPMAIFEGRTAFYQFELTRDVLRVVEA